MRKNHVWQPLGGRRTEATQAKAASRASWQTTPRSAETIRAGLTTEPANIRSIRSPAAVQANTRHRKFGAIFASGMPSL